MSSAEADTERLTFGGELWTDANGKAEVELAPYLRDRGLSYRYQIRLLNPAADAAVAAELAKGRLLISSNAPHLKLAWQVTAYARRHRGHAGQGVQSQPGTTPQEEEKR
jgi:hypothetical protein